MATGPDKALIILSGEVKTPPFSQEARVEVGRLMRKLQLGHLLSMPHSRPMPSIGTSCHELRIPDGDLSWRILYFIDTDAIVVLEIFSKKTQTTPENVIAQCKRRLAKYLRDKG